jgi:hypothetical protein
MLLVIGKLSLTTLTPPSTPLLVPIYIHTTRKWKVQGSIASLPLCLFKKSMRSSVSHQSQSKQHQRDASRK